MLAIKVMLMMIASWLVIKVALTIQTYIINVNSICTLAVYIATSMHCINSVVCLHLLI